MVITMWATKYHTNVNFISWFLTEQEYIDAEFVFIVMYNFGIVLAPDELHRERG